MEKIKSYLKSAGLPAKMIEKKINDFAKHKDIADDFIYWIENKRYKENGVKVADYSAKTIASKSTLFNGLSVFTFLIQLRENPDKAKSILNSQIHIK